jgi:hypothetical protein
MTAPPPAFLSARGRPRRKSRASSLLGLTTRKGWWEAGGSRPGRKIDMKYLCDFAINFMSPPIDSRRQRASVSSMRQENPMRRALKQRALKKLQGRKYQ